MYQLLRRSSTSSIGELHLQNYLFHRPLRFRQWLRTHEWTFIFIYKVLSFSISCWVQSSK